MESVFSGRVLLWAVVALAVVGVGLGAVADSADAQSEGAGSFSDDDGSVHEVALNALASRGVLDPMECGEGLICPSEPLKRWEMAVWLVRVLDGADPGSVATERFSDVDYGLWWAPFVERLFDTGIMVGCQRDPLQYCPDNPVTRSQMATFLTRAFDLEPAPSAGFTDVSGGSHGANIDALAAAGITVGCQRDPLQFCPSRSVTRGQMASFLARAMGLIELPAAVRFTAIDAGYGHTCGLRADRTVACWGDNHLSQADAPDGQFLAVSAGGEVSCAINTDRAVVCWGATYYGLSDAPDGQFQSVTAGFTHSCGLRIDGTVACWGTNYAGQSDAPDGQFEAVTAGFGFSCASRDTGLTCWGVESQDEELPEGRLATLTAGIGRVCGLRDDSTIACFGSGFDGQSDAPGDRFHSVSVGGEHTCGLHESQTIVCWGNSRSGQIDPPRGEFLAATAGSTHSCGVRLNGTAVCWGDTADGRSRAPEGHFISVSAGRRHTCGLLADSSIACWGNSDNGQAFATPGEFRAVAAGRRQSCAVGADFTLVCWGTSHSGAEVPEGRFSDVTVGGVLSCGSRVDGTVACWGNNTPVENVPEGRLTSLSTGRGHACALRSEETIVCWGHELAESYQHVVTQVPDGRFKSVSAGSWQSCGLKIDGTVVCWGDRHLSGEADSPAGEFQAVSAGELHTCGIRKDGTVVCWGRNTRGQAQAPAGRFRSISAGHEHSCGVRVDSTVVCWGSDAVARPPGVRSPYDADRPDPAACAVYGTSSFVTAGFPRHWLAAPTTGTVRVAVLFMDFADAVASHSTRVETGESLAFAERYLEEASYGALNIKFVSLHRWLRSEHESTHYLAGLRLRDFDSEAARLADPHMDFSEIDILMTVLPSEHFSGGTGRGSARTDEGLISSAVQINVKPFGIPFGPGSVLDWGRAAAHELLHALGLADLYALYRPQELIDEPPGKLRLAAGFGIMGLAAYFLLDESDPRTRTFSPGHVGEMLAWSRWQLGWIDPDEINCVTGDGATVSLRPVALDHGNGTAMSAVPLNAHEVIVIESRRSIGRDRTRLLNDGVLVYVVNASIGSGALPIKVVGAPDQGFPALEAGESVTVRGYTIAVVADDGDTHTVTITKTGDG